MRVLISRLWRAPEIFIALTIVGLLALTVMVVVDQTQRSSRDSARKESLASFSAAIELFRADYGVYPNYAMTLGQPPEGVVGETGFDLASTITVCQQAASGEAFDFTVGNDLQSEQADLNLAYLKPGFTAVNQFLGCLSYPTMFEGDPLMAGTVADYQYRVSADAKTIILAASLERSTDPDGKVLGLGDNERKYYLGNGLSNRALFDDSDFTEELDKSYFQSFGGKIINNGRYLYQCLRSADGRLLTGAERVAVEFAPFIHDASTNTDQANPACQDTLEGLLTVPSN